MIQWPPVIGFVITAMIIWIIYWFRYDDDVKEWVRKD